MKVIVKSQKIREIKLQSSSYNYERLILQWKSKSMRISQSRLSSNLNKVQYSNHVKELLVLKDKLFNYKLLLNKKTTSFQALMTTYNITKNGQLSWKTSQLNTPKVRFNLYLMSCFSLTTVLKQCTGNLYRLNVLLKTPHICTSNYVMLKIKFFSFSKYQLIANKTTHFNYQRYNKS